MYVLLSSFLHFFPLFTYSSFLLSPLFSLHCSLHCSQLAALHCTGLHWIALLAALHWIAPLSAHCSLLAALLTAHCTALLTACCTAYCTARCNALHCTALLMLTALHCTAHAHCTALHCSLHCTASVLSAHCSLLTALHCNEEQCREQ
jgi:hypothetical protein